MTPHRIELAIDRRYLLGRDRTRTRRGIGAAVALLTLSYVLWHFPRVSEAAYNLGVDVIVGGFVLVFASAALHAYANDGIVVCWLLVSLPIFGATLNRVGVGLSSPTLLESYGLAAAIAGVAGVALGTVGFLLGIGLRQLVAGR